MTKLRLALIATTATLLPLAAHAQTSGSRPGLFDVSANLGWQQMQSADPSIRQWAHTASAATYGTNCNIASQSVVFSNRDFQAAFDAIDEQTLLAQLRSQGGVNYAEISPVQTGDLDGMDAFRLTARTTGEFNFTAIQYQAIFGNTLVAVTCGSDESGTGVMLPTLERFVETTRFSSGMTSAKIENDPQAEFPALLNASATSPGDFAADMAIAVFRNGTEQALTAAQAQVSGDTTQSDE
ncbi:hypothetical protein [Parvularcula sp. IMCC14364]|uniref:hypothetical protein n=1 Tax=Parvularcula sp. IMCC14364 TaxID=3067902 RepID=UPI0027413669|nr:hypothetical protein [Parvularcula sp. IMCC14364]